MGSVSINNPLHTLANRVRTINWKSCLLLGGVTTFGAVLLVVGIVGTVRLPLWGWAGLAPFAGLIFLTLASSRFTVAVTSVDGVSQSYKSAADAFIFLAVMMYTLSPANNIGPALVLAAIVGFISSFRLAKSQATVFTIGTSLISTFVASLVYRFLVLALADRALSGNESGLVLNLLLFPLCVFGLVQYSLSTFSIAAFNTFRSGTNQLTLSRESLMWTLITQFAGVTSAALFYSAIHEGTVPFFFVGFLIIVLVHFLYRFNETRVREVRRSEADKLRYAEEIAALHMNTIESLAIAIDAKDQTTHGHVRRTQLYATQMGTLLKVSEPELRALTAGALLHDIGKLAVPEYILNKPGKLTESEFAKMKIHPTVGGDILKRVNFPYPVEDIVRYHHEKWNGSGYPKGLKGDKIPLVARIISVVDFYDATRCDRPYRKGMKREESLTLLQKMSGTSFDPKVVDLFVKHVTEFDSLLDSQDIQEQVPSENMDLLTKTRPDAGLAADVLGVPDNTGFRSITEAQREVFALHEIAQTIGSSLNMKDTVTLISNKLRAIVPFDTCIIFIVDDLSGKAIAMHVSGDNAEHFERRRMSVGDGITGWVIANARSMCNSSPELDLVGLPDDVVRNYRGVLVSPLIREDGAFGAITLYSKSRTSYTTEHVRLLESVAQHAASALNNAITFEKTKESALIDALTGLPNARGFYMVVEQRLAECQRMSRESLALISMDIDDFKIINDQWGHALGDRLLASVAHVIRKEMRQMDILSRYAGDEFVAIMPMASTTMAETVAERIRKAVAAHEFPVRTGKMVGVTISTGFSCFPADGETTEELLTAAARNMQHEKNARKNLVNLTTMPVPSRVDHYT
jgi:diguanylate cyclase (GGDEF)-like protein/putative nucleotidyltransferase with HDIG domain